MIAFPNDAITFLVTLRCKDVVSGCKKTAPALAAIRAESQIAIVDVPEGWLVTADESERRSYPQVSCWDDDRTEYFDVRCPDHAPRRRP